MPRSTPRARRRAAAEADRDPPRGHRHAAEADGAPARPAPYRFILFCDDLSFDHDDTSYKSLKAALEGGVEGRPANVIFYATSNRRHLLPRDMIENERSTAINPSRGGRGEGVAVRPLRPVARLPQMLAGRISGDGRRLCRLSRAGDRSPSSCAPRRSNGRRRAAAAPAASPGSSCRTWPAGWASPSGIERTSSSPRSAFATWPLSKNAPCHGGRSREAGHGPQASQLFIRGPVSRAPPVFLPRRRTGPLPVVSVRARTWGLIAQWRTVSPPARHRRPPLIPGPDQGSREGDAEDYAGG